MSFRNHSAARAILICILTATALGSSASANHSWNGYHWARTSNPFTLQAGDNVSAAWDAYLNEAILDWNVSPVLNLVKVASSKNPRNCRPTTGRIEVCNAAYGNTGWLGIAQIWITGSTHIVQGTTKLNDTYFNTATYNTPAWRRLVTCQEIAHDFGLDHQDETFNNRNLGSCMDYTNDPDGGAGGAVSNDPSNEHPNQHDFDELQIIYAHLDSTTTVGSSTAPNTMPPAMGDIDFANRGQWGRLIHSNRNGRVEVYELDFGRGNKVVTHVFWADPEGDAAQ